MEKRNLPKVLVIFTTLIFLCSLVQAQQQEPYKVHTIPGKIEAEHFDKGGEGISYHDVDNVKNGDGWRVADTLSDQTILQVAIDSEKDIDEDKSNNIAYTVNGEWLEYTIDTVQPGTYTLLPRMATSPDAGTQGNLEFYLEDSLIALVIFGQGDWKEYGFSSIFMQKDIVLKGGRNQVLKVVINQTGGGTYICNLNWFEFSIQAPDGISSLNYSTSPFLYPNPATSEFSIDLSTIRNARSVEVFDINGKVVLAQEIKGNKILHIESGKLGKAGLYFVKVTGDMKIRTGKVYIK